MKTFSFLFLFLIFSFSFHASMAQRAHKTAAAKAYYGTPPSKPQLEKKIKSKSKAHKHFRPAQGTKTTAWMGRRKVKA